MYLPVLGDLPVPHYNRNIQFVFVGITLYLYFIPPIKSHNDDSQLFLTQQPTQSNDIISACRTIRAPGCEEIDQHRPAIDVSQPELITLQADRLKSRCCLPVGRQQCPRLVGTDRHEHEYEQQCLRQQYRNLAQARGGLHGCFRLIHGYSVPESSHISLLIDPSIPEAR